MNPSEQIKFNNMLTESLIILAVMDPVTNLLYAVLALPFLELFILLQTSLLKQYCPYTTSQISSLKLAKDLYSPKPNFMFYVYPSAC